MDDGQRPLSVLCVDDGPESAETTASFLEQSADHLSAIVATSVREALEYLESHTVDCIVSGYEMEDVDGLSFLEIIRADGPDLPFVLFTGRGSEALASDAIAAGVSDYMQKGSGTDQYEQLARRVTNAVAKHRARNRNHDRTGEFEQQPNPALTASPDAVVVSVDGTFVYANPAAVDLYGVGTEANLLGRDVGTFIHPDYREAIEGQLRQVEAGETTIDYIPRTLFTLDGDTVPVEVTARHIVWEGESGVVAIVRDRSRRVAYERRQARYEGAFDHAFDSMVIADRDGRYIEANQSACTLFGVEKETLLGQSIEDFVLESYDLEATWRTFETAQTERGTLPLVRPDGDQRTVEYAATANVVPGEHLSVLRDITDKENREQVLGEMSRIISERDRSFTQKVTALLALARKNLNVGYGTLSKIHGTEYVFEIVDTDDGRIQAGDTVPVSATNCELVANTEKTIILGDISRDAPDETDRAGYAEWGIQCYVGAPVFVDDAVYGTFCFYDTEPRPNGFSEWEVTLVDLMSRWVGYELQRQQAKTKLTDQNAKLEEFASIVAHDLRNPLNVLAGSLELAQTRGNPEDWDNCQYAVDRMQTLIEDLLSLARAGRAIDDRESVRIDELVNRCWATVATKDATLEVETTKVVNADRSRFQQLLENIIRNAIEHGGAGVTVTVGDLDTGFYIENDGPSIPADAREKIFQSGYSTRSEGTGFGLAIGKEIVEAHGWAISAGEGETGGARFSITGVE